MVGFIQNRLQNWRSIGAPAQVLDWVENGVPLNFTSTPEPFSLPNRPVSPKEGQFISKELNSLLQNGTIRECDKNFPVCISPIHCVPKKNNDFRLICDLRRLNQYCDCPSIVYEDINHVKSLVKPDDYLVTADIKSGYQHVHIANEFQKFLGFCWKKRFYVWQRLPFGLNLSAFYFVKIIRSVISYLRSQNIRCNAYVDDFLLCSDRNSIVAERDFMLATFEKLGIIINKEKSSLEPSQECLYIGYILKTVNDDNRVWLKIPSARLYRLRHDIKRVLSKGSATARMLARIAGQCISMVKAVLPGKLLIRNVYRLLKTRQSWQDILQLDQGTVQDLQWWMEASSCWNGCPIQQSPVEIQMSTDASSLGWGAVAMGQEAQGVWNKNVSMKSSNYRELLTVLLAMLSLIDIVKGKVLQVLSDNITTVCYINMMGVPSRELTEIATAIWALAFEKNICLSAKHLAGVLNVRADSLSRLSVSSEWQLHPRIFAYIDQMWGPHTIDRFSSMVTCLLPTYNSRYRDPYSSGVDAFAQRDWHMHMNFINAPFRLISRILSRYSITRRKPPSLPHGGLPRSGSGSWSKCPYVLLFGYQTAQTYAFRFIHEQFQNL